MQIGLILSVKRFTGFVQNSFELKYTNPMHSAVHISFNSASLHSENSIIFEMIRLFCYSFAYESTLKWTSNKNKNKTKPSDDIKMQQIR